ncbi:ABC transporter permease [Spirillospora sp. NPDC050679]
MAFLAVCGGWIAPHDPLQTDALQVHAFPSAAHLLGTDDTGRDILSRLIVGARPSLIGPVSVIALAAALATVLAIVAAWHGGLVDAAISRAFDIAFAFPSLILAIVVVSVVGVGLAGPVLALAVAFVPYIGRVVRAASIRERSQPYVAALELQGMSGWRICLRHVLPNVLPLILVQSALALGYALLDLAAISYVGLGVQPPSPEWGLMVANGQSAILEGFPQQSLFAVAAIVLTVVSVNVLGGHLSARAGGRS